MRRDDSCIFCRIVSGDIPSSTVYEDDVVVAFRDLEPAAPTHVLVIPREHVPSLHDLGADDSEIVAALIHAVQQVASVEGIAAGGYRVATNIGVNGGQSVGHLHLHVLGGRGLGALG
jgi:histidine triad (HIT) family protein